MIILGIDPGNVRAGYGFIKKEGPGFVHLRSGLIKISPKTDLGIQLLALERGLTELLEKMRPDVVGVEKIFMAKNKKTGVFVAQARGLILKVIAEHRLKLLELTPSSIKLSVTGYGRADKKAVAKMVGMFLNIETAGLLDDETDALAIAIAASNQARF